MALPELVELSNGVAIPSVGLGTFPMDDDDAEVTVAEALAAGYRLLDTAESYDNEAGVGRGLRASGVDRAEVFITTKFNQQWHGEQEVQDLFAQSARKLGVQHIDMLLIHWPNPVHDRYVDAWRGMIKLLEAGDLRAIGVSNFTPEHIDRLVTETGVVPHVNQLQLEPRIARTAERAYHEAKGVLTQSWAPLGKAGSLLQLDPIVAAARRHGRSPGQIVLRWHLESGAAPVPKSQDPQRLRDNLAVYDFELSAEEMSAIDALDGVEPDLDVLDPRSFGH